MAGFLYWLPSSPASDMAAAWTAKDLAAVGLSHLAEPSGRKLVRGTEIVTAPCPNGPGGMSSPSGVTLTVRRADQPDPPFFQFHAGRQTWVEHAGQWIGWDHEQPPEPEDLRRQQVASGKSETDLFGRSWIVPVARLPWQPFGGLATYVSADGQGKPAKRLLRFEQALWDAANALAPALIDDQRTVDLGQVWDVVTLAVSRNYRVGPLERAAFEAMGQPLLDEAFCVAVAMACCHLEFVATAIEKKNVAA